MTMHSLEFHQLNESQLPFPTFRSRFFLSRRASSWSMPLWLRRGRCLWQQYWSNFSARQRKLRTTHRRYEYGFISPRGPLFNVEDAVVVLRLVHLLFADAPIACFFWLNLFVRVVKRLAPGPTSYNDPINFSSGCLAAVISWPGRLIQAVADDGRTVQLGGSRFFSLNLRVTEAARSAGGDAVVSWPPGQLIQAFGGIGALAQKVVQDLAGRALHPRCRVVGCGREVSDSLILSQWGQITCRGFRVRVTRALLWRDLLGAGHEYDWLESALAT